MATKDVSYIHLVHPIWNSIQLPILMTWSDRKSGILCSFAMWVIVGRQPHTGLTEVWGEDYVHIYSNNWRLDLAELEKECLSQVVVKRDILSREYSCTIYCWFDHRRTWEIVSFLLLFHWLYFWQFLSCRALLVWMVRESTCPLV